MSADYKVQKFYEEYIHDITDSQEKWKNFLKIQGRLYGFEFDNGCPYFSNKKFFDIA